MKESWILIVFILAINVMANEQESDTSVLYEELTPKDFRTRIAEAPIAYLQGKQYFFFDKKKVQKDLIKKGAAFSVIEDTHLIALLKMSEEVGLEMGMDIGILSYSETPMKGIIFKNY